MDGGILVLVLAGEGSVAQSVGNVVDGIGCDISNFLHGAGHFDLMVVDGWAVGVGVDSVDVKLMLSCHGGSFGGN